MLARRHQNSGRAKAARTIVGHAQFVRGFRCMVEGPECEGKIQSCHVDFAGGKGMGLRVHDEYQVPMCRQHHLGEQHVIGWDSFIAKHGLTHERVLAIAADLARRSPRIIQAAREAGVRAIDIHDAQEAAE